MLLSKTSDAFYSLGSVLWWPGEKTRATSGILQGVSITCKKPAHDIILSGYQGSSDRVRMVFSVDLGSSTEILCSLDTAIDNNTFVYALHKESDIFISGYVVLTGNTADYATDIKGGVVNQTYISWIDSVAYTERSLKLGYKPQSGGTIITNEIPFTALGGNNTATTVYTATESSLVYSTVPTAEGIRPVDNNQIRYINGTPIISGTYTVELPATWSVSGNNTCAEITGGSTNTCTGGALIASSLAPIGRSFRCPIDIAYGAGERMYPETISSGQSAHTAVQTAEDFDIGLVTSHRFNAEYEVGADSSAGLKWNELSVLHDGLSSVS